MNIYNKRFSTFIHEVAMTYVYNTSLYTRINTKVYLSMVTNATLSKSKRGIRTHLHYFGNESNESLLEAYGIISKDQQPADILKPKQCPNCNEPNNPTNQIVDYVLNAGWY